MTTRMLLSIALVVSPFIGGTSRGQSAPASKPPLGPYLNQLRGLNPAVNYYFGVAAQNDRRSVQLGRPGPVDEAKPISKHPQFPPGVIDPAVTGHAVQFMNCAPYFQLNSGVRNRSTPQR